MKKILCSLAAIAVALGSTSAIAADKKGSSGHQAQKKGEAQIPVCTRNLGTIAIVEPDNQWWRELNLGSPEAIIKLSSRSRAASAWSIAAARCRAARWNAPWPIMASCRRVQT